MIFIERFIMLVVTLSFIVTLVLIALGSNKRKTIQSIVEKALSLNSKKELENLLIVYDKDLDKNVKQRIRVRIDDLSIAEDEQKRISDFDLRLQNKG